MPPSADEARQRALRDALDPSKNPNLGKEPIWLAGSRFAHGGTTYNYGDIVTPAAASANPGAVIEAEIPNEIFNQLPPQAREPYLNRRQSRGQSKVTARVIPASG